jgi:protein-tyrosine phosphatase
MRAHAARHGYNITHISRPMCREDWDKWDLIVCMDAQNRRALSNRAPSAEHFKKVTLATNYCDKHCLADCVPDPYYGGEEGFEYVIDLLEDACAGLIDSIIKGDS